mgnify:FL=1
MKKKNDPFFVEGKKQRDAREARLEKQRSYAANFGTWVEIEKGRVWEHSIGTWPTVDEK